MSNIEDWYISLTDYEMQKDKIAEIVNREINELKQALESQRREIQMLREDLDLVRTQLRKDNTSTGSALNSTSTTSTTSSNKPVYPLYMYPAAPHGLRFPFLFNHPPFVNASVPIT